MPREYKLYLEDILHSIKRIRKYTENLSFEDFSTEILIQDAVMRNLEVIGEAVKNIPEEVKRKKKNMEWRKIAGLRDILIHAYFSIDLEILWEVIINHVPKLEETIKDILT